VAGVFIGTIIGSLCTADWYRPIVIYKHVFHTSVAKYYKRYGMYVGLGLGLLVMTYTLTNLIQTPFALITFVLRGIVSVVMPIAVNCLLFWKTGEFHAIHTMFFRLFGGLIEKIHSIMRKRNG
jgi:hypothetical protein